MQGDTSSAFGGALGAAQCGLPVAHVGAGLRSHDRRNSWPEEDFRIAIDRLSDLLFAPTALNAANLQREGSTGAIHVTGNTGIDAVRTDAAASCDSGEVRHAAPARHLPSPGKLGRGLAGIAACLAALACRSDVAIDMVLHPNPRVAGEMRQLLGGRPNVALRDPCGHVEMLRRMQAS